MNVDVLINKFNIKNTNGNIRWKNFRCQVNNWPLTKEEYTRLEIMFESLKALVDQYKKEQEYFDDITLFSNRQMHIGKTLNELNLILIKTLTGKFLLRELLVNGENIYGEHEYDFPVPSVNFKVIEGQDAEIYINYKNGKEKYNSTLKTLDTFMANVYLVEYIYYDQIRQLNKGYL